MIVSVLFSTDSQETGFNFGDEKAFWDRGESLSDDLIKNIVIFNLVTPILQCELVTVWMLSFNLDIKNIFL